MKYLLGQRRDFDLPSNPAGDDPRRPVWREVGAVPFGGTTTYGRIARRLGAGRLFRP